MRRSRQLGARANAALAAALVIASLAGCTGPSVGQDQPASTRCAACHLADFQAVSRPPHPGVRPITCAVCHLETSWHPDRLLHSWPLEGAHAKTDCLACHVGDPRKFEGTSKLCVACHQKEQAKANAEVTHHAEFPAACETCHSATAWKPTRADAIFPPEPESRPTPVTAPVTNANAAAGKPARPQATPPSVVKPPAWPQKPDSVSGASRVRR